MIILQQIKDIKATTLKLKNEGKKIGFVPTMGALHPGHLSLMACSKKNNDITVCSIFVNPTQFNDPVDFEKYPVTLENDILLLEQQGIDILFLPSVNEMYPEGINAGLKYDLGDLETTLEGAFRPGHFQGVCQVVHRLLEIISPDQLWLGQKDFQQYIVLKKLIELLGLPVEIRAAPTLRESDGLAFSSRNVRLTDANRKKAPGLYKTLLFIKENASDQPVESLKLEAEKRLKASGFDKIEYVEVVDAATLIPLSFIEESQDAIAVAAGFLGGVRLIDNLEL